jgi:hypothetical protein
MTAPGVDRLRSRTAAQIRALSHVSQLTHCGGRWLFQVSDPISADSREISSDTYQGACRARRAIVEELIEVLMSQVVGAGDNRRGNRIGGSRTRIPA